MVIFEQHFLKTKEPTQNSIRYPMLKEIRIKILVESICKFNLWRLPVNLHTTYQLSNNQRVHSII